MIKTIHLLQARPALRLLTLTGIVVTMFALAAHFGHASQFVEVEKVPRESTSVTLDRHGCDLEIDGKVLRLRPGEGVRTGAGWRNCETYDGHRLLIFSADPPRLAVLPQLSDRQ